MSCTSSAPSENTEQSCSAAECLCEDDKSTGVCDDGETRCTCTSSASSKKDAGKSSGKDASSSVKKDGGTSSGRDAASADPGDGDDGLGGGDTLDPDDGTGLGSDEDDAGLGDDTGGGDVDDGTGGSVPPPASGGGDAPTLPQPTGACPEFKSGTATIGGLSGISLQVGAKKSGTGSLLFYWHGTGSFAGEVNTMVPSAVRREILDQGGIIVSPQSSTRKGSDCSGTRTFSQGDMEIMDLIAACAVKNHGIDPRRIYTTGCSAGGLQAGCFAARRSSYVAAAAPNSGGLVFPQQIQDPKHVPALMTMHGSAADTVIVTFSQTSATADNLFAKAGGEVVNCNHGGGHCAAPGALQTAAWRFMKDHPFGAKPYASGGLPSGYPSYCKMFGK